MEYTSFSRLTTFTECPRKYAHRYIYKTPAKPVFERHFAKGNLVHSILEHRLNPSSPLDCDTAVALCVPLWLAEHGLDLDSHEINDLLDVSRRLATLLRRASCRAVDDPIRNADGSVPKDVLQFAPKEFTAALQKAKLTEPIFYWNNFISQQNPCLENFVYLLAECLDLACHFEVPPTIARTIGVEVEISPQDNPERAVYFPNSESLVFNARIDWVFQDNDGYIYIADHKTSKETFTTEKVAHHLQLLVYAYLFHLAFDTWVDFIAINHLPSGNIVCAPLKLSAVNVAIRHIIDINNAANAGFYPRRYPLDYNSPCRTLNYRNQKEISRCPYYDECWPGVVLDT